jgi:hypothetical protein
MAVFPPFMDDMEPFIAKAMTSDHLRDTLVATDCRHENVAKDGSHKNVTCAERERARE